MAIDATALRKNLAQRQGKVVQTSNSTRRTNATPSNSARKPDSRVDTAPNSSDAERGVLSSCLQDPENCIPEAQRACQSWFFYNNVHRVLFETLCDHWDSGGKVDMITFTQFLRDKGQLEAVGGPAFIVDLQTFVPSPVMLSHYIGIVREKAILRETISIGNSLAHSARGNLEGSDEISNLLDDYTRKLERVKHAAGGPNGSEKFDISELRKFDALHDPDCLVGRRYLVRGGNCLIAGGSGYGKSSLEMQIAVYFATGTPIFGLRATRPLRQLIIQAENDKGDLSEQLNGVFSGIEKIGDIDLDEKAEQIEKNIGLHRVVGKSGTAFLTLLDTLLEIDRPDVVWIDPLFSFAGCDLVNSEKTGKFLREGLFPIFVKRRVCGMVLHHIGKPVRDRGNEKPMSAIDYQYLGFGTSEIQNSFRAVNILVPVKGTSTFKLVFSKRGERAGAKDKDGSWTREVYLQHSAPADGICWLQADEPEETDSKGGRPNKYTPSMILDEMSIIHPIKTDTLRQRLYRNENMSRATFFALWQQLRKDGKVVQSEDGWVRKGLKKREENESQPELV